LNVLLISTYELGRQPFGLASPAAWLQNAGFSVECLDLSRDQLAEAAVMRADFIAFYVPMHTATRLAVQALDAIRQMNPRCHICFYGLYAPVNEKFLRKLGAQTVLGGEFEEALVQAARRAEDRNSGAGSRSAPGSQPEPVISFSRLAFITPDRSGLPELSRYAHLEQAGSEPRITGYTEASRGCKHVCRHCPIVPVYQGRFRIVPPDVVLADIRQQAAAGARHITFGDPDFFNGIRHALAIVTALHREHPSLTYDVTVKVEHLLRHAGHILTLRDTGCVFVTTAVESMDDTTLARLEKGHTYADFLRVLELFREARLALAPTFIPFMPWTSLEGYAEFLDTLARLDLADNVPPVQLGLRLLIPAGSRLLELGEIRRVIGPFSEREMVYPWKHPDPRVDALYERVQALIREGLRQKTSRRLIFNRLQALARQTLGLAPAPVTPILPSRASIPYLTEPWYC
jgi:radical SAM superfamily enzyme YgiQ (UPF0313 family)